ncbi:MAG: hypothetical protein PHU78_08225 [Heliobacteriaceae bacterium]|nr:hypothetical protein [Heliobacteriaceae bacterium]
MGRRWGRFLLVLLVVLVLAGVVLAGRANQERWQPKEPAAVAGQAIAGTLESRAFRFASTFLIQVDGRDELVSRFTGERSEGDKFHLKGIMLQSPAEIYLAGNLYYLWDPVKKVWYTLEKNNFGPQDLLLAEVSPLTALDVNSLDEVTLNGREKVRETECLVLDCRTEVGNRLLTTLWKDFRYRLWLDPWEKRLHKGVLEATSRNAPGDKLILTVEFWDYDGDVDVEVPVVGT